MRSISAKPGQFCRRSVDLAFGRLSPPASLKRIGELLYEITLEEYHAVAVHPTSFGKDGYLDPKEAYYPRFEPHSGFFHNGKPNDLSVMANNCKDEDYRPDAYRVLNIFPNFLVNHYRVLYTWYVSITQYIPVAFDSTVVRSWYYQVPFQGPKASWFHLLFRRWTDLWLPFFVGIYLRRITNEDHVICEAMQMTAGSMIEEPLLGLEEQRIAWFREAYWDALAQLNGQENSDA
ncbi:RHO alpha subunit C-terminal catalytic domain-containing protein [Cyanobium sp. ATX-6F1]|uniref:RHO alpha subunit C-terminal catalytic domain-containing protein n=1 Tax=Cyanobium sp. ATX-6F1 TaxID=3137388 RepID=UPI0039BE42AA